MDDIQAIIAKNLVKLRKNRNLLWIKFLNLRASAKRCSDKSKKENQPRLSPRYGRSPTGFKYPFLSF